MQSLIQSITLGAALLLCACGGSGTSVSSTQLLPAATASLSASQTSVADGGAATLTWSSMNATACTASGGWSGVLATSGTQSTGNLAATTTYSLTCSGAGGSSAPAAATVSVAAANAPPTVAPPTVTLSASPTTIASGGTSTLTWASTNATACTSAGGWSGTLGTSGSQSTATLTATTSYTITCTGPGGSSTAAMATVTIAAANAPPTVTLTASPTTIAGGGTSTLTWSSTNATACTATGGWTGTLATAGTQGTGALTATTGFGITCAGPGGTSAPSTVQVTVAALPTATLTASPTLIPSGGTSMLTWSSTNATGCTAAGAWTGTLGTSGTYSTGALTSRKTYTLTCAGPGGTSATATATVQIANQPTVTLNATPSVVTSGGTSTLAWTSANASSCSAGGGWSGTLTTGGSQSIGNITATTTYAITCTGAGGTGNASVMITVSSSSVTVTPHIAALTVSQTQQYTASVPGGGATWSVDGIPGGNAAVGTVDGTGLYTAGTAVGAHTVLATSLANTADSGAATAAVTDLAGVYTYHNDLARDGLNAQEYALTPANVNSTSFGKLAACTTDGAIYAQPLWAANLTVNGGRHNVVFVATQHDSLYAFDADASPCSQLWQVSLIDTAHGGATGETPVPTSKVGNRLTTGDVQPEIGVTSTPVIDPLAGIIYVLAKSIDATQTIFAQRLHAIDLATGNEKPGSPVVIAGSVPGTSDGGSTVTFSAQQQSQRPGLALVGGVVYIAWASHEDSFPFHGWVMGYQYSGTAFTQTAILNTTPNGQSDSVMGGGAGGIWMGGGAPAADTANNLYVVTGNGNFDASSSTAPNNDYGDSLLQLSPGLSVLQYLTPNDQLTDRDQDLDFGAGGAAMLADLPAGSPIPHLLICGGKDENLYVANRDALGGFDANNAHIVQKFYAGGGISSTGALWNNTLYIASWSGALSAYQLDPTVPLFTLRTSSTARFGGLGSTPSVSAAATANGVVWALNNTNYCTDMSPACGPTVLYAFDASATSASPYPPLWTSGTGTDAAGFAVKYSVPTVANGKVYVGTRGNNTGGAAGSTNTSGELDIYGLKP